MPQTTISISKLYFLYITYKNRWWIDVNSISVLNWVNQLWMMYELVLCANEAVIMGKIPSTDSLGLNPWPQASVNRPAPSSLGDAAPPYDFEQNSFNLVPNLLMGMLTSLVKIYVTGNIFLVQIAFNDVFKYCGITAYGIWLHRQPFCRLTPSVHMQ